MVLMVLDRDGVLLMVMRIAAVVVGAHGLLMVMEMLLVVMNFSRVTVVVV